MDDGFAAPGVLRIGALRLFHKGAQRGIAHAFGFVFRTRNRRNPEVQRGCAGYGGDGAEGKNEYYVHSVKPVARRGWLEGISAALTKVYCLYRPKDTMADAR
jgi:hypothetical protein